MSPLARLAPNAGPTDLLFMGYVAFTGLLLVAMGWRLESAALWAGLIGFHMALLAVALLASRHGPGDLSFTGFLRDAYPLLFVTLLYFELRWLALFFSSAFHDPAVLAMEEFLFGEQLAMTFSERVPVQWVSETFHFFYAFYWLLLPLAVGALYFRRRLEGVRELVWALLVTFFACYLFFIFWPVQGPHYEFPLIGPPWSDGFWYGVVHTILEDGGSKGAAFPSSHVAVAVSVLPVCWRHDRALFWSLLVPVTGLTLGTVYGRFHYGIDALAGAVLALVVFRPGLRLRAWLGERTRTGDQSTKMI